MLITSLTAWCACNTSTAAMTISLALGMLALTDRKKPTTGAKFLLLDIAYSVNIGGIVTMITSMQNATRATLLKLTFDE